MLDALKQAVLLRRIAKATERQADALETVSRVLADWWYAQHPIRSRPGSRVEFGVATTEELNAAYEARMERESLGNYSEPGEPSEVERDEAAEDNQTHPPGVR